MDDIHAAWLELRARVDELGAERQQYLDLFELASDAYLMTSADGAIREANGAAADLLQRRRRVLRGKPLAALVSLAERAEFRARLRELGARAGTQSWRTRLRAGDSAIEVDVAVRRTTNGTLCWRLRPAPPGMH
jgi:PAS domain S-box-containing protein